MPTDKKALKAYQKTLITPATIQRALLDARGELEDKDIFLSPAYHAQLNSLSRYLVGRTGRKDIAVSARVIWDDSESPITAYTDNEKAVINAAYPKVQKLLRRNDRHYCIMGFACHEFAHCIFTDFKLLKTQYEELMKGNLYPTEPVETPNNAAGLKGLKSFLAKGNRSREAIWNVYKHLDNAIEDGYIERSIIVMHPGDTKKSLRMLNEAFFGGNFMDSIKEDAEEEPEYLARTWSIFVNALLFLFKTGNVDIDPTYSDYFKDINARIAGLVPRIMRELENSYAPSRKELAWDIILENWDLLEQELEHELSQMSELEKALSELSDEELNELIKNILESIIENAGSDHNEHNDSNGGIPVKVFIELPCPSQEGDGDGIAGESNSDDSDGSEGEGSSKADSDDDDSNGSDSSDGDEGDNGDNDGEDEASDSSEGEQRKSGSAVPQKGTAAASNAGERVTIRIVPENEPNGSDDSFRKALNNIENDMAKQAAGEKVEKSLQNTLQTNANIATAGDWRIDIKRKTNVPNYGIVRHGQVWPKISPISKTLKKELLKILQERRQGSKQTGLIQGRRLDSRSLYKIDEKYFVKNRMPNERPTVATALLIDQSGSMNSHAHDTSRMNLFTTKIEAASNAALLLYDFCFELGFPIMVAGHTTGRGDTVSMEVMASFQKRDKEDRYRICAAEAISGNRDGTALNYMLSELKKRQEEIKLLFIISDGVPSDYRGNENGVQHVQEVLKDAHKSGVLTFAAALNEDFNSIKVIYGDNMFEITDLAKMPRTLLNVMKMFIK